MGEIVDGVDMRAEVALLSRNILIQGEMERSCYGNNWCQYYSHDTFGGHVKVRLDFILSACSGSTACLCVCVKLWEPQTLARSVLTRNPRTSWSAYRWRYLYTH